MTRHVAYSGNPFQRGGGLGIEQGRKDVAGLYMTSHFSLMKKARAEAVGGYEPICVLQFNHLVLTMKDIYATPHLISSRGMRGRGERR